MEVFQATTYLKECEMIKDKNVGIFLPQAILDKVKYFFGVQENVHYLKYRFTIKSTVY
jgi:hypothetical protein